MPATTTQTIRLIDCPACKERVIAELTYSVKLKPTVYAEDDSVGPIDKTATATLTLTGVRIQHECPPPKPISFFTGGGRHSGSVITTHNPVIRERTDHDQPS